MRLTEADARARFAAARVARLATVDESGQPHLVPVVFVVHEEQVVIVVDHKPKQTRNLRRIRNIQANDRVCLLVDEYAEDWSTLWWARADGVAVVHTELAGPVAWLAAKYPQYQQIPPPGPVISVTVAHWSGWSAS